MYKTKLVMVVSMLALSSFAVVVQGGETLEKNKVKKVEYAQRVDINYITICEITTFSEEGLSDILGESLILTETKCLALHKNLWISNNYRSDKKDTMKIWIIEYSKNRSSNLAKM